MIAALFVERGCVYWDLPDVDPYDEQRDARLYAGPWPVVAHPPCQLWTNMAAVNWKRYRRQRPARYPGGDDGGCFASALASVRAFGGVLEHPALSHAWPAFGLQRPKPGSRQHQYHRRLDSRTPQPWVCEVWQSAYGHRARKQTWLYYVGQERPPEFNWSREPGTAQCGWFDRIKPTLSKREASATPLPFLCSSVSPATHARGQHDRRSPTRKGRGVMRTHELKTWPEPFRAMVDGTKTFEVRKDDRAYAIGDVLYLRERDPEELQRRGLSSSSFNTHYGYTARQLRMVVSYILHGGRFGLPEDMCVMAIRAADETDKEPGI